MGRVQSSGNDFTRALGVLAILDSPLQTNIYNGFSIFYTTKYRMINKIRGINIQRTGKTVQVALAWSDLCRRCISGMLSCKEGRMNGDKEPVPCLRRAAVDGERIGLA